MMMQLHYLCNIILAICGQFTARVGLTFSSENYIYRPLLFVISVTMTPVLQSWTLLRSLQQEKGVQDCMRRRLCFGNDHLCAFGGVFI